MRRMICDNGTLLQGDALAMLREMPDASVDAVVTDPPYSSGGLHMGTRQRPPQAKYLDADAKRQYPPLLGDNRDQRSFAFWATMWLAECHRVSKPGASLLVFCDWRQLPVMTDAVQAGGWIWRGVVVWDKPSARPILGEFRRQCEFLVFGVKSPFKPAHRRCLPGVYRHTVNSGAGRRHMTEKPLDLMKDVLQVVPEGGLVFDPFIGAGTTAIACLETGRRFLGMELSPEYFEVAKKRIETAEYQPK